MKKIKCPICEDRFSNIDSMYSHMEDEHDTVIPEDFSAARYAYMLRTGKDHGSCIICKKDTEWNEVTNKYKRFCNNPKCKETYKKQFQSRMMGKYGKTTLLNDPEHQKVMLSHRSISGEYKWTDGTIKTHTGSYELDFLKMLDVFMNFDSDDIITPSPHTYYYIYENKKHFYIPDAFIPSLQLEIEIKDGLSNPNTHHKIQDVDKVKEKLKDAVMNNQKDFDYIKIMDKNYDSFFKYLLDRKVKEIGGKDVSLSLLESTQSSDTEYDDIIDLTNAPDESEESEEVLSESVDNTNYSPVYLILTQGRTPIVSAGIRYFTDSAFTHVSISFTETLDKVYSFNFRDKIHGFTHETMKTFKDNIIYIYAIFVHNSVVDKLKEAISDYENAGKTKYDFRIFANKVFKIDKKVSDNKYNQVCSTFVDTVLKSGGINLVDKIQLAAPGDIYNGIIKNRDRVFLIYKGKAPEYSYNKARSKVKYMYKSTKSKIFENDKVDEKNNIVSAQV